MSYDLYFCHAADAPAPRLTDVVAYFSGRRHYAINELEASYENEDTGVHFGFDRIDEEDRDDEDEGPEHAIDWTFGLNLGRPTHFAHEAALELIAFTDALDLLIVDPQLDDDEMPRPFDADRFIETWSANNRQAAALFRKFSPEPEDPGLLVPRARLLRDWEWMHGRHGLQERVPELFVPSICYLRDGGRAVATNIWAAGIPLAWPRTEWVLLNRQIADDDWRFRLLTRPEIEDAGVPFEQRPGFGDTLFSPWGDEPPAVVQRLFDMAEFVTDPPGGRVLFFHAAVEAQL